ncbi:hypothetical protein [Blastochloris viridis]|uniref:hypothetical protein n=1 Tax=Blastochloris viridis TaxID=1079 RepID=UPI0011A4B8E1|nr:hypothetical protein [Blastochloris viridis]
MTAVKPPVWRRISVLEQRRAAEGKADIAEFAQRRRDGLRGAAADDNRYNPDPARLSPLKEAKYTLWLMFVDFLSSG